jgi:hypothetical protein
LAEGDDPPQVVGIIHARNHSSDENTHQSSLLDFFRKSDLVHGIRNSRVKMKQGFLTRDFLEAFCLIVRYYLG